MLIEGGKSGEESVRMHPSNHGSFTDCFAKR